MKKLIKWIVGIIVFVVLLLLLAVVLLPIFFDPNEHKPEIQKYASTQLNRQVTLDGPIEWSVFPWLAINLNKVSVANEKGFKGTHIAEIEDVSVRVKVLPLLKKQIKVGLVELKEPQINLQIANSGKSNWQSMLKQDQSSSSSESSTDLEIRGVELSNATLNYTDGSSGFKTELNDLSFTTKAIKDGIPTEMSLNSNITIPADKISGFVKGQWKVANLLNDKGMLMNFDNLEFDGALDSIPLGLSINKQMQVDLATDQLTINKLNLGLAELELSTNVVGKNISKSMQLSGTLEVNEFSIAEFLETMGSPLDNNAKNRLSGKSAWTSHGDKLRLSDMSFKLDDSNIIGSANFSNMAQLKGVFNLEIDELNADKYLPNASESSSASSGPTTDSTDFGKLRGDIKIGKLKLADVNLAGITLKLITNNKKLSIEPLNADFYQGLIKTKLTLQPENTTEKLKVTHEMQDIHAGNLIADILGSDYLTGLGQLKADLRIDEPFSEKPFKTANGSISYKLTDGDIVGVDVFQIMQQSLSMLNKTDAAKTNEKLKTEFGLMEIQADVTNGILKTNTLTLKSPYFDMTGDVEIDLDAQVIRGTIQPMLTNIPEGVLDKKYEKLLNLRIPVKLKGNLLEPSISIDIAKLLLNSQKSKINEKKEELKADLFDAILGKKDKKDSSAEGEKSSEPNGNNLTEEKEKTDSEKKKEKKDKLKKDLLEGLFGGKKKADTDDGDN